MSIQISQLTGEKQMTDILKKAWKQIRADKRVDKSRYSFANNKIEIESKDGFRLSIKKSDEPASGPLYFTGTGDSYYGDYVDITRWIDRHEKYLGGD